MFRLSQTIRIAGVTSILHATSPNPHRLGPEEAERANRALRTRQEWKRSGFSEDRILPVAGVHDRKKKRKKKSHFTREDFKTELERINTDTTISIAAGEDEEQIIISKTTASDSTTAPSPSKVQPPSLLSDDDKKRTAGAKSNSHSNSNSKSHPPRRRSTTTSLEFLLSREYPNCGILPFGGRIEEYLESSSKEAQAMKSWWERGWFADLKTAEKKLLEIVKAEASKKEKEEVSSSSFDGSSGGSGNSGEGPAEEIARPLPRGGSNPGDALDDVLAELDNDDMDLTAPATAGRTERKRETKGRPSGKASDAGLKTLGASVASCRSTFDQLKEEARLSKLQQQQQQHQQTLSDNSESSGEQQPPKSRERIQAEMRLKKKTDVLEVSTHFHKGVAQIILTKYFELSDLREYLPQPQKEKLTKVETDQKLESSPVIKDLWEEHILPSVIVPVLELLQRPVTLTEVQQITNLPRWFLRMKFEPLIWKFEPAEGEEAKRKEGNQNGRSENEGREAISSSLSSTLSRFFITEVNDSRLKQNEFLLIPSSDEIFDRRVFVNIPASCPIPINTLWRCTHWDRAFLAGLPVKKQADLLRRSSKLSMNAQVYALGTGGANKGSGSSGRSSDFVELGTHSNELAPLLPYLMKFVSKGKIVLNLRDGLVQRRDLGDLCPAEQTCWSLGFSSGPVHLHLVERGPVTERAKQLQLRKENYRPTRDAR